MTLLPLSPTVVDPVRHLTIRSDDVPATPGATRLARATLAVFAAAIPLDVAVATRLGSTSTALGIPLAIAAAWELLSTRRVRPLPTSLIFVIAFTAWSAVSIFWAQDVVAFRGYITTRAQLLMFVLLAFQILRSDRDVRVMLAGFLTGCVLTAADVWRAYFFVGEWGDEGMGRYAAYGFDPNDMAATLAVGIPVAAYFALRGVRRSHLLLLAYIPLAASAIALSASRGGALTAVAGTACVVAWAGRRNRVLLILTLVFLGVAIVAALRSAPEASWTRMVTIREELGSGTLGDRRQIWRAGLGVFGRHPLLGVGTGGFLSAVAPEIHGQRAAHNTLLSVAVELGLVGLLLFIASLGSVARRAARALRDERALVWSLVATWAVASASLTWENQKTTWFVLLVGAGIALRPREGESR